ncbi:odorant receptor 49a-like [Solenopsis invicta]|uniref:odorant receptor 49a-like n=1 Tax=Solenopsis invicta TaxID=13686 RepID=UPI00193E996D|nr:odorant receptor 49a-like [Solenopsis invicta]
MFDDHHYKFNETLLRSLGLWPIGRTKCESFRAICFYMLLISRVIAEFAQFIIADISINIAIGILLDSLSAFLYLVIFNMFFFNPKELKQMLEEIVNNRQKLTDSREIKILEYYSHQGEKFIVAILWLQMFILFTFIIMGLLPDIFDFLRPLNESRTHSLFFMKEYRINVGIQYYFFLSYSVISIAIGTSAVIFIISTLLSICLHCCAMFKICCYRIKQFADNKIIACSNKRNEIIERIIRTVELHRKAKQLSKLILTSFTISCLSTVLIGTCGFAMSLCRLLNALSMRDSVELGTSISYIIGYEFCLSSTSFVGQLMINHADELFNTLYMSLWYKAPITIQKSLLFIMQISAKNLALKVGGIFVITMETFNSITSTSMSFMAVIYSIQ